MKLKAKVFFRLWNESLMQNTGGDLSQTLFPVFFILATFSVPIILVILGALPISVVLFLLFPVPLSVVLLILPRLVKSHLKPHLFNILFSLPLIVGFIVGGIFAIFIFPSSHFSIVEACLFYFFSAFLSFSIVLLFAGWLHIILGLIYTGIQSRKNFESAYQEELEKQQAEKE